MDINIFTHAFIYLQRFQILDAGHQTQYSGFRSAQHIASNIATGGTAKQRNDDWRYERHIAPATELARFRACGGR